MTSTLEYHSFFGDVHESDFSNALQLCRVRNVDSDAMQLKLAQRYITGAIPFSIRGTSKHIRSLTAALLHPSFSSAPDHSNQLIVHKPLSGDMPLKGHSLPTFKDIEDLLRAMPNLKALTIGTGGSGGIGDRDDHEEAADKGEIQTFNKSREDLGPSMTISSNLLVDVLCTFYVSLRHVDLTDIHLQGTPKKEATWETIYKVLSEMNLEKLHLADLWAPGTSVRKLMSDLPFKYEKLGHMCHTEEDPDVDMGQVQGGGATYSLWGASFWQDYVKKGLEKLLGLRDFPVYHEELVADDGNTMKLVTVQLL